MKNIYYLLILIVSTNVFGQKHIPQTYSITISGAVEEKIEITIKDIQKFKKVSIPNLNITSHNGIFRKKLVNIEGVPIKEIISKAKINTSNPKLLSEYYFIFKASDAYKVVYSWNEIFNNSIGDSIFIVTKINDVKIQNMNDKILVINTSDTNTGRRHIKGLKDISIKRID